MGGDEVRGGGGGDGAGGGGDGGEGVGGVEEGVWVVGREGGEGGEFCLGVCFRVMELVLGK